MVVTHMPLTPGSRELKKGSAEMLILSLVEDQARHGYDIARSIDLRSQGEITFHVASLYPLLYRLEQRGWLKARWVEKAGQRRRRMYAITPKGAQVLAAQRQSWQSFVAAINRVTDPDHA
jgi:PadR family transcriptional regulator, regulatory protein PadR